MSSDNYTCPACDKDFDSRRGLGVHHVHVHDERLPNRTCAECEGEFYSEYSKKYCSEECLERAAPYAGEKNPNYRDAKETTECELCGSSFEYYPSEKPGLFCSNCVEKEEWRDPPYLTGEENPRWNGGPLELTCEVCGDSFERIPSLVTGEVTLCSDDCRATWLSDAFTGEGHPNWKGGGNEPYGKGWSRIRREALERDGYKCVLCSKTKDDIGRNPDVHHIIPVRVFIDSDEHEKEDAHTLDNVASLCVDCHRKADFGKISTYTLQSAIGA